MSNKPEGDQKGEQEQQQEKGGTENLASDPICILLLFTLMMLTLPLSSYFVAYHYISNNSVISAGAAVLTVQLIIAGYIYIAWREDCGNVDSKGKKNK